MSIEQNIVDAVSISLESKVPVLFMSNPGLGKTTIMKRFAQNHGMHLESLIGSRFTPEEISGYQVNNGGDYLQHMNPEWFNRIHEKAAEGINTLLFIDELSTCSEAVQGSLLSLIFDRTIGNGKKLPEECLIVSAANYASNLPPMMNIMAPTINRFAVVNLGENYTGLDMLDEFLNPPKEIPQHKHKPMTQAEADSFMERYRNCWKDIFVKYSDEESAVGILDVENTDLDGLYTEGNRTVYNFISGRSLSYLSLVLKAYKELGIKNSEILNKLIDGLVGAGTCSFKEKKQEKSYRNFVHSQMKKVLNAKTEEKSKKIELVNDISMDVASYFTNKENLEFSAEDSLKQLLEIVEEIKEKFSVSNIVEACKTEVGTAKFVSDMDAIIELQQFTDQFPDAKNISFPLTQISMNYYGIYCDVVGIYPDFMEKFGKANKFFEKVVFVKRRNNKGKTVVSKAALRFQAGSMIPSFYLIGKEETFLDVTLGHMLSHSEINGVLVFERGLKFIPIDEYIERIKNA